MVCNILAKLDPHIHSFMLPTVEYLIYIMTTWPECSEDIYGLVLFSLKYSLFSHIHIINKESFALTGHTSPAYFHFAAQTYIYLFIAIKSAFLILLKN